MQNIFFDISELCEASKDDLVTFPKYDWANKVQNIGNCGIKIQCGSQDANLWRKRWLSL